MLTKTFPCFGLLLLFLTIFFTYSYRNSYGEIVSADEIIVKDYTWYSSNVGSQGILKDITLINKSDKTFNNIDIVVDLYSRNDVPLGSVMSTIESTILPGEVKTFKSIKFGLMHADVQKSIARVARAELVKTTSDILPKELILVKDWKWLGNQFGTEGILKEITIANTNNKDYKNIKLSIVNNLGRKTGTNGKEQYITSVVIRDALLANSTSTYTNVNIGFVHPDSKSFNIYVSDAEEITEKEVRYMVQEKQKKDKYEIIAKEQSRDIYKDEDYVASDDEIAIPKYDIQVKDFKWGSGVPGSQGIIRELTLRNRSGFAYSSIDFEVEFLSSTGILLASNDFTLTETLPPRSTKTYKNIKLGVIVIFPSEKNMKIIVKEATPKNRAK